MTDYDKKGRYDLIEWIINEATSDEIDWLYDIVLYGDINWGLKKLLGEVKENE